MSQLVEVVPQPLESSQSLAVATSKSAQQRETNYYMSKERAIRCIVMLFDTIKDLISENDRRCNLDDKDNNVTLESQRLNGSLMWFIVTVRSACNLVTLPLITLSHGFTQRLQIWRPVSVRAGIRDHADGYIMMEMSWPAFLYEKYSANQDNLEKGLFQSVLLLQAFKAIFTSPSSAKDVAGEGNGANVIKNSQCAKRDVNLGKKVKTHVAQIIKMCKVMPHSITYVSCQVSVDGNFDYIPFWQNIVNFFEWPPGCAVQQKVDQFLAWWTRKVFGTSCHVELIDRAKAKMSVNALARQRVQLDDTMFDSE
ncbi:uncharacterized protein BJ212DRAFT_1305601 [Suillus subaureus]|uniref:Uncharacterized protein n=1 Tax=Suillus subaureus TaxID=48587 RepID=A0A9P7DNE2_9AGAM|nr:uncharacterized protein BJ212DRAFT_1305601 [Suillus subaureus]KAG1799129.1 hypothetical protein BJ212DRAFT_1305601 [Suillus subaureus]